MKNFSKRVLGVLSAIAVAGSSVASVLVLADDSAVTDGYTVEEQTRFTPIGVGKKLVDISKYIRDFYLGLWTDPSLPSAEDMLDNSGIAAYLVNQYLADYANASTTGSYTIQDSYSFVAKRHILYPYADMQETDYLICFVDKNAQYQMQQFGDYYIAPNTMLMVRQTSWGGTKLVSIPITDNNIDIYIDSRGGLFELRLNTVPNDEFKMVVEEGVETFRFRHAVGWNESGMKVINSDYNSIDNTNLQYQYSQSVTNYNYYLNSSIFEPLDDLECFLGTGYAYEMSSGLLSGWQNWFMTSGYLNVQYPSSNFIGNTNNNINNTVNPQNAPVYVVPNDSPFHSGETISQQTINNYNDYGITYDNTNNEFELDLAALGAALGAEIIPEIAPLIEGTFGLQPEIGADFGLSPSLDYNYFDLVTRYIQEITPSNGEVWQPPSYPAITTYDIVVRPTFPTVSDSVPEYLPTVTADIYSVADRFLGPELLPIFIILALFGICISIIM